MNDVPLYTGSVMIQRKRYDTDECFDTEKRYATGKCYVTEKRYTSEQGGNSGGSRWLSE